jgi:hypothetical protein
MWSRLNLIYLAACACVLSVFSTFPKYGVLGSFLVWVIVSVPYPFCLAWTRSATRFWAGLFHFSSILIVAQIFSFCVYLVWYGALMYPRFGDKSAFMDLMQSNAIESAVFFVGELIESAVVGVLCYAVGYPGARWLVRLKDY